MVNWGGTKDHQTVHLGYGYHLVAEKDGVKYSGYLFLGDNQDYVVQKVYGRG
jgi:hypothetical protein